MSNIFKGACWAGAILINAAGNYLGLIDDVTARTLFIVLPIIAVMSHRGRLQCRLPFPGTQA
jgi:hypothetical protein